MSCPDCKRLEARVRELETRLGISRQLSSIGAVVDHCGVSTKQARLLLRLYGAGGKPVHRDLLMSVMSTQSADSLKATIYQMRGQLGEGVITTYRHASAYGLSLRGMSLMLAALERPEFQDVRG